ncbi:MAG: 30S ribosomal protein S16 [Candidatus Absconditabacterales bacterium]
MLTIRLSRHGRKKVPFYRVVLTEHTKPVKAGYKDVLGWYDPMKHVLEVDVNIIKEWIKKGAMPSERIAKLLYQQTKDDVFQKFFVQRERHGKPKKEEKK